MRELLRRAWHLLRHRRLEDELQEELAFHREMTQQALEEDGVSTNRIAAEAQRVLGNDALARNHARDVWIWPWLQDISQDLRFATRILAKDPRFTLAAIVALGLGIGVTNTVFTHRQHRGAARPPIRSARSVDLHRHANGRWPRRRRLLR